MSKVTARLLPRLRRESNSNGAMLYYDAPGDSWVSLGQCDELVIHTIVYNVSSANAELKVAPLQSADNINWVEMTSDVYTVTPNPQNITVLSTTFASFLKLQFRVRDSSNTALEWVEFEVWVTGIQH